MITKRINLNDRDHCIPLIAQPTCFPFEPQVATKPGVAACGLKFSRWFTACLFGLLAGLCLSAQSQPTALAQPELVKLQLKWVHKFQFAGFYAAIEKGYYRDAGLKVELIEGQPSVDFVQQVASGEVEYGVEMPDLLLRRNAGAPVVVLAALFQHSPVALISLADAKIKSPQDLAGRRVMLRSTGNVDLRAMIIHEGVALEKIKELEHSFNLEDLVQGKADAMSLYFATYAYDLKSRGISVSVLEPINYGIDFYGDCLFTSERELHAHPQRVKAFREASLRGWEYAMDHPEEIARLIHEKYAPTRSVESLVAEAEAMQPLLLHKFVEIGHMNPGRWRHIADTFSQLKLLPANFSLEGFLYNPDPTPTYTWLKWFAAFASLCLLVFGFAAAFLLVFNRRLESAAKERSARLKENEERFRWLVEAAPEAIFVQSEGRFVYVNPPMLRLLGACKPDELLGKDFMQYMAPEFHDAIRERIHRQQETSSPVPPMEQEYVRLDGSRVPVETTAVAIPYEGRQAHLVFVRDISERTRAGQELLQTHELMRYIIEHARSAIAVHDRDLRYIYVSDRYRQEYKVKERDIIGKHHYEVFPDLPQKWREVHQRALAGEVSSAEEDPYVRDDGSVEWTRWECRPWYESAGSIGGIIIYTEVITERVRAEEQIRKLSQAVEQSPVSIVITDLTGAIEYVNPKFVQLTGYTPDEVRAQNPRVLKGGGTSPEEYRRLWQTITAGGQWHGEFHNRKKNGTMYWENATISPIVDAQGRITHFIAVKEDITERKTLEAQLLQAQKLESVGQLAGGVAHDFNNILASTMMHLSFLRQNSNLDRETQESLEELTQEAQRAANLARQLLMFSRRSVLEVKTLDLNETVGNLLKMLGRLIGEHINLVFSRLAGLPAVEADPGMIEQVLMNLCVNARDAMPKGGTLTIGLEAVQIDEPKKRIWAGARRGLFVCLSVADTGCGMGEATLQRIFEPFFTTKEAGKGTGLGLATVHGIVGQHQGWVEVESQVDQGTMFRVFLPAAANQVFESVQAKQQAALRGNETILLVEDEASVRRITAQNLRLLGYGIFEAASGPEALEVWNARERQIDLLLTDMVMPGGLTGLDLADKLRETQPNLKVIIASGYSADIVNQGVLTAKHIIRIQKPCPLEALSKVIRQCLEIKDPE